jgi:multidrug transporter EmrE-like cation transporter
MLPLVGPVPTLLWVASVVAIHVVVRTRVVLGNNASKWIPFPPYKMISPFVSGLLLTGLEAFGDTALKHYAIGGANWFLAAGVSVYGLLAGLLAWLFQYNGLAIVNAMWDATSNVMTMALGYFLFHETYTVRQWLGMAIVAFGIVLMK